MIRTDKSTSQKRVNQGLVKSPRTHKIKCAHIFSSPEHEVLMVSYRDQSLSVVRALSTFCFKRLLLKNGQTDFEIILQDGSLGDPLPKLLKPFRSVEQDGRRAKNRKTFKRLLLQNQKMDFEIIIQECFFGDPLPKLLKEFGYIEQNGRQGYKQK